MAGSGREGDICTMEGSSGGRPVVAGVRNGWCWGSVAEGLATLGPREKATLEPRLEGYLGRELFHVEEAAMVGVCVAADSRPGGRWQDSVSQSGRGVGRCRRVAQSGVEAATELQVEADGGRVSRSVTAR